MSRCGTLPSLHHPVTVAVLTALIGLASGRPPTTWASDAGRFASEGRVVAIDEGARTLTIEHGAITGLLPAARSQFTPDPLALVRTVRVGQTVRFALDGVSDPHGLLTLVSLTPLEAGYDVGPLGRLAPGLLGVAGLALVAALGLLLWRRLSDLRRRADLAVQEARQAQQALVDTQAELQNVASTLAAIAATVQHGYLRDLRRRLTSGRGQASPGGTSAGGPRLVVVRRGKLDVYRALANTPGVQVVWDRRVAERRTRRQAPAQERRGLERRVAPADTWAKLGFLLGVEPAGPAGDEAPDGATPRRPPPPRTERDATTAGGDRAEASTP